jgi:hypothetical protein
MKKTRLRGMSALNRYFIILYHHNTIFLLGEIMYVILVSCPRCHANET